MNLEERAIHIILLIKVILEKYTPNELRAEARVKKKKEKEEAGAEVEAAVALKSITKTTERTKIIGIAKTTNPIISIMKKIL